MKSLSINIGERYGAWEVIGGPIREKRGEGRNANYLILYLCRCDCGTERSVRAFKLLTNSRSCGCKTSEIKSKRIRHGQGRKSKKTHLYSVWSGMVQRCGNINHKEYKNYGGRNILLCKEWKDFITFSEWAVLSGYNETLQIDRINNDKGYDPENCRWVTEAENKRNTRQNRNITAFGETKCITDWALDNRCSVTPTNLRYRILKLEMPVEEAITCPRRTRKAAESFKGNHVKS